MSNLKLLLFLFVASIEDIDKADENKHDQVARSFKELRDEDLVSIINFEEDENTLENHQLTKKGVEYIEKLTKT